MQINAKSTTDTQRNLTNSTPETSIKIVENGTGTRILGFNRGDYKHTEVPNFGNVTELNGTKNISNEKVSSINTAIQNSYPKDYNGPTEALLRLKNGNLALIGADQFERVKNEFGKHSANMQLNEKTGGFSHPSLPGRETFVDSSGLIEANPRYEKAGEKAIDAAQESQINSPNDNLKFKMPGM